MKLDFQKRIAADILKASPKRVVLVDDALEEIGEAVTKEDIRSLIKKGAITLKPKRGVSRARANKIRKQKAKGKRKNKGSRKGKKNARTNAKQLRINSTRKQKEFIKRLRQSKKISSKEYRKLYLMIKGGFFRNLRHLKLYVFENVIRRENKNG